MSDRDRLIELKRQAVNYAQEKADERGGLVCIDDEVDYLLANGVIVPPCKVGNYVRFKGLTTLWQVDAIHYYREGLPQITVTNGKISQTVTNDGTFEVFTKEEAERALKGREG